MLAGTDDRWVSGVRCRKPNGVWPRTGLGDRDDRQPQGSRARPRARPGETGCTGAIRWYADPRRGPRIGLALVRPERHRPLGLRGDRQRRVHAEVGGDRRAVDDVQPGVVVDPLVGVDHAGPRSAPMAQPPMKWAVSGMLNGSPMEPPGVPPMISAIRRTASLAIGIHVGFGLAVALLRGHAPAAGRAGTRLV